MAGCSTFVQFGDVQLSSSKDSDLLVCLVLPVKHRQTCRVSLLTMHNSPKKRLFIHAYPALKPAGWSQTSPQPTGAAPAADAQLWNPFASHIFGLTCAAEVCSTGWLSVLLSALHTSFPCGLSVSKGLVCCENGKRSVGRQHAGQGSSNLVVCLAERLDQAPREIWTRCTSCTLGGEWHSVLPC